MMEIDKVVVVKISFLFSRRREARVARTLVQLYGSLYYFWEWLLAGHGHVIIWICVQEWTLIHITTCLVALITGYKLPPLFFIQN